MRNLIVIGLAGLLAACALGEPSKRADNRPHFTRIYEGVSREQALQAARAVIEALDRDDIVFADGLSSINARRVYFTPSLLIAARREDLWTVRAEAVPGGAGLEIDIKGYIAGEEIAPSVQRMLIGTDAAYRLFFDRVSYMLGKTDHWMTCADARRAMAFDHSLTGRLDALCHDTMANPDGIPPGRLTR